MSEDAAAIALATQAGLEVQWTDAKGDLRTVCLDTLRAVLKAIDLPAGNAAEISESTANLRRDSFSIPPLQVVKSGEQVRVADCRLAELVRPDGTRESLHPLLVQGDESVIHAPRKPGYYQIEGAGCRFDFAVVSPRCIRPDDLVADRKLAGIAVQVYSLRGGTSGGFGDFAALAKFASEAHKVGIDAIMASPTHALFGADPGKFSPYSPSTRLFLNPLFADVTLEGLPASVDTDSGELIDWGRAGPAKLKQLRAAFARFREKKADHAEFIKFCRDGGARLHAHAQFESLDAKFRAEGITGFKNWPTDFQSPDAAGATAYARGASEAIKFQLFLQWLTARSAAAAQEACGSMAIGIIADIAVGMDPQGSHAWSAPDELLRGLHVGAPPDIFNTRGQDWGLTSFSPRALQNCGYGSFLATLRANMDHAGGVRIDHALGLRRLWVIPSGAPPADGVYLHYPQRELLGLITLESHLRRAIVIGEDLGTVPEGFRDELVEHGALGMQVLWFERDLAASYLSPKRWRRDAVAMTTTHDLPTIAGWWSGHDIDLQVTFDRLRMSEEQERTERGGDREQLWSAFRDAGCANGDAPPPNEPETVIPAALQFIGKSNCSLAIAPLEDIAGERHQPNLPGTTNEHPNWRRRLKLDDPLRDKAARERLEVFTTARHAT